MGISRPKQRIIVVTLLLTAVVAIMGVFSGVAFHKSKNTVRGGDGGGEIVSTNVDLTEVWPHELSDIPIDTRIQFGILPNGMRYMIGTATTTPSTETLSLRLYVQAGSMDEEEGKNGVSR
jgi:hypothetical protein